MAAGGRSGSFGDRSMDLFFGYFKLMIVVAVLFGASLMLSLNHVVINATANVIGGIVREVPAGAQVVKQVQASGQPVAAAPAAAGAKAPAKAHP